MPDVKECLATRSSEGAKSSQDARPLLKWPGGKRKLVCQLLPLVGSYGSYFEPFCGGAALFFALKPSKARLSDANSDLITTYRAVAHNTNDVIAKLSRLENSEDAYYAVRKWKPRSETGIAARMIYLTTFSFNGMFRVNLKGEFNVPYGQKTYLSSCNPDHIRRCAAALKRVSLKACDVEDGIQEAKKGDLVYFDPPYTVNHNNNGFVKYNSTLFSWADQMRLSNLIRDLVRRGTKVILSNADHPSIVELYPFLESKVVSRFATISGTNKGRKITTERVFYNRIL